MPTLRVTFHRGLNGKQEYSDIQAITAQEAIEKVRDIEINLAKRGDIIVDGVKPIKRFKFTSVAYVTAETQEEAEEEFANNSWDFAANADCEEVESTN